MGFGDSLLATADVKKAKARFPDRPVVVGNGLTVSWCEVYDHNPKISREITPDAVWVRSAEGLRPYIDYAKSGSGRFAWNYNFRAEPGEIFLTEQETDWPDRDFVYIEPNVKGTVSENKDWGFDNWQRVVDALPGIRFIQGTGRKLANVEQRDTQCFRHAVGLLSHARLFVGTDGGLHHAAAAVGKPAVVVWTGFSPAEVLGYPNHINLQAKTKACGSVKKCAHCDAVKKQITVEKVIEAIESSGRF